MSTSRDGLPVIPEEERARPNLDLDLDNLPVERTLEVQWEVEKDVFLFTVREPNQPPTKRRILSAVSSLHDPMGFVCPVVLEAKKILQKLWKLKLEWDDEIPEDLQRPWNKWKSELPALSRVQVPRCHLADQTEVLDVSLHLFLDASEDGYGMCSYLRFVHASGAIRCSFLIGRSRSSPVRPISIPRLERQAATLSVKMHRVLMDELTYKISGATVWKDSQTTLQYIKNKSKRFQTYVANRVVEIREMTTPDQWRHCPGRMNPADDASRGLKPQKLSNQHRWWRGPEFLWEPEDRWPNAVVEEVPENDPEVRASTNVLQISVKQNDCDVNSTTNTDSEDTLTNEGRGLKELVENYSSWSTLQRRVAWIVRFCHWIMSKRAAHVTGSLTLDELNQATHVIVRSFQNECFTEDVK